SYGGRGRPRYKTRIVFYENVVGPEVYYSVLERVRAAVVYVDVTVVVSPCGNRAGRRHFEVFPVPRADSPGRVAFYYTWSFVENAGGRNERARRILGKQGPGDGVRQLCAGEVGVFEICTVEVGVL